MKIVKIFKPFLPLIIAFFGAVIFFASYNHYLLDSSLVNLKLSLKNLDDSGNLQEVKGILDDTFLQEISRDSFDLAAAIKLEISTQLIKDLPEPEQVVNEKYLRNLNSAMKIDLSEAMLRENPNLAQIKDAKHFINEVIEEKSKGKFFLVSKIEDALVALFPKKRKVAEGKVLPKIDELKKDLSSYQGPQLQEKYLEIARLYLRIKDLDNSFKNVQEAIRLGPDTPSGLKGVFYLGIIYKAKGDFQQASATFNQVKNKLSGEWKVFSSYQEATAVIKSGEMTRGLALLEEIFGKNPSSEISQLSLFLAGHIYLHDLNDQVKSREIFNKLAKETSGSKLGQYITYKVNEDVSASYIKKGFNLLEAFTLLKQSRESSDERKCIEALEMFNLALETIPNEGLAYGGKALAFYFLGRSEEALKVAEKSKELSSKNSENIAILGFIYYNLGMMDRAIAEYKNIANKTTSSIDFYNLATLYALKNDYSESEKAFRKAIKFDPEFSEAYNNLGYVLWLGGKYTEAKDFFKKSISLNSDYLDPHYNLGVALYAAGDYEGSRKEFLYIDKINSGYKAVKTYLARIKEKLGY